MSHPASVSKFMYYLTFAHIEVHQLRQYHGIHLCEVGYGWCLLFCYGSIIRHFIAMQRCMREGITSFLSTTSGVARPSIIRLPCFVATSLCGIFAPSDGKLLRYTALNPWALGFLVLKCFACNCDPIFNVEAYMLWSDLFIYRDYSLNSKWDITLFDCIMSCSSGYSWDICLYTSTLPRPDNISVISSENL